MEEIINNEITKPVATKEAVVDAGFIKETEVKFSTLEEKKVRKEVLESEITAVQEQIVASQAYVDRMTAEIAEIDALEAQLSVKAK